MEEDYILARKAARKVASKICSLDNDYFEFFTVAIYAILRIYDDDYKDFIIGLVEECDIYFDYGSVEEIMKKNGLYENFDFDTDPSSAIAVSIPDTFLHFDETCFDFDHSNKPTIVCSKDCENLTVILNTFIHEFQHLLTSYFKPVEIKYEDDEQIASLRSGLSITRYVYDGEDIKDYHYFRIINEAITVVRTTEAMKEILSLKEFCPDDDVLSFIDELDRYYIEHDFAYEEIIPIFRTLWKNEQFKQLVERNIVSGDIQEIVDEFNEDLGVGEFQRMAQLLDDISYTSQFNKKMELRRLKDELRKIIKAYNTKNNVLQKRTRQN